jgi:hypothetical protein
MFEVIVISNIFSNILFVSIAYTDHGFLSIKVSTIDNCFSRRNDRVDGGALQWEF